MWIFQVALLAGVAGVAGSRVQDAGQKDPAAVRLLEPEFDALLLKYGAAVREYDEERVRLARKGDKTTRVDHPSRRMLPDFLALAAKDSGGAQGWVLENLCAATDDSAERVRIAKETFARLVQRHASEDSALHAIDGIRKLLPDLGEPTAMEMAGALEQKSNADEVKGAAMMLQADVRSEGGKTKDPDRWLDTTEIYRSILYLLPKTRAGKQAAGILLGPIQKAFYEAERRWVDALLALQAAGKSPEEWPPQPIHDFQPQYQAIAAADHHDARRFVNRLYPAYGQAETQGKPFAYQWLAEELGRYLADGPEGPWNALRADLALVLYRQFPREKWVLSSVRGFMHTAESMPPDRLAPAFQALIDASDDPRVLACALFGLAQSTKMRGDQQSYEKAIELFTRVRDDYPESGLRVPAEGGRSDLARSMPGAPAPSAPVKDADGLEFEVADYRGRVVMLEFWSFQRPGCLEAIPSRAALRDELSAKPFNLVGMNIDGLDAQTFREKASKAGIQWRTGLITFPHPALDGWEVRRYPTTILIDKQGIIRARNLPWEAMVALARKLVDEVE